MGSSGVSILWFIRIHDLVNTSAAHFRVEVKDISLTDYIQIRNAVYLPHTLGRYQARQFKKAQMPIVERLVNA